MCRAFWPMRGSHAECTQWLRRIWNRGSVRLVTERCSSGNPVVRLANGIRTLCVRETEPGDGWEALHSRIYLAFSLNLASSLWHCPTMSLLRFTGSQMWTLTTFEKAHWVSQKRMFCADIWIFLNDKDKKQQFDFLCREENQLKHLECLAPKHCQCFKAGG